MTCALISDASTGAENDEPEAAQRIAFCRRRCHRRARRIRGAVVERAAGDAEKPEFGERRELDDDPRLVTELVALGGL